jgi:hypothetical protein
MRAALELVKRPRASGRGAGARVSTLLLAVTLAVLAAGCQDFAETVSCRMGLVLDEEDRCVPPPVPDGSVVASTCEELCALAPTFSEEQLECLERNLAGLGPLPPACMNLSTTDDCLACTAELGATDAACATASALCP